MHQAEIERLVGGPPRLSLDVIVNHPRMVPARKAYIDRFLEVYSGDPFLVRLLIESGRFIVYHSAVGWKLPRIRRAGTPGSPSGG